ncbi:hypothetical protein EC968_010186 [Mortierella alpina]|nr:hypothetical protein EC968_010186 [Mortierella alpina]
MAAGDTINVRFYASDMNDNELRNQPKTVGKKDRRQFKQARHGGGMCEFSISYDEGESFVLIGRYTKTCPDSSILPQFYMNCADIKLTSKQKSNFYKPKEEVAFFDFKKFKKNGKEVKLEFGVRAQGDGAKHTVGDGPIPSEVEANKESDKKNLPNRERTLIRTRR